MKSAHVTSLVASVVPDEVIVVDNDPEGVRKSGRNPWVARPSRSRRTSVSVFPERGMWGGDGQLRHDICIFIDDDNVVEGDAVAELSRAL
jgi:hypothetical protein